MALVRWIFGLLAAVAVTAFAIANQQIVDVYWNPFRPALQLPLYIIVLGPMAFGFFSGSLFVWLGTLKLRFSAHRQKRQIKNLEKQLGEVKTGETVDDVIDDRVLPLLKG